ncbi:MAG: hypothetical protein KGZ93_10130 [Actinobacteria bacterium]|nr:hypothetical protein [Actinomycetota bacterium]
MGQELKLRVTIIFAHVPRSGLGPRFTAGSCFDDDFASQAYALHDELVERFADQIECVLHNIFFDNPADVGDLADRIVWDGLKLPVVFIGDEPELVGYIDEPTVIELLHERGLESNRRETEEP